MEDAGWRGLPHSGLQDDATKFHEQKAGDVLSLQCKVYP